MTTSNSEKALVITVLSTLLLLWKNLSCVAGLGVEATEGKLPTVTVDNLSEILPGACALLCTSPCSDSTESVLLQLNEIFNQDSYVYVGLIAQDSANITWKQAQSSIPELAFYSSQPKDRTCLLSPPKSTFKAESYNGPVSVSILVQFLNEKCNTHRTIRGSLNSAGMFHAHVMSRLYLPQEVNGSCERIAVPDQPTFFQQYLFQSKPVIIEGGARQWPAMSKWTMNYLKELYGNLKIHIKLTEDGNFEGVENASVWENYHKDWIPQQVRQQLRYPDLVVVRPATAEMNFSEFLDYIISENRTYSAYLEYSSIPSYLPLLEKDIQEMPFVEGLLKRRHLNIWLSDGNTLGKLHFDPYDNFLCQISGEKHLTLFDPHHNENLYEGHIPEAKLHFDPSTSQFSRRTLLESTSMVMSPVDIVDPNLQRFPKFANARRLNCILRPGDVLFMPSFWWHEVQSYPDHNERRNLAINFWYEPVLNKEFPCEECKLKFNNYYKHFLDKPPM